MLKRSFSPHIKYLVGVDEAGRGPLAGPVAVGVVAVPVHALGKLEDVLHGVRDSKKLSPQKREAWVEVARELSHERMFLSAVALTGVPCIDERGITRAIANAMARALRRLNLPPYHMHVLLDGGLRAPRRYHFQETIIRGDDTEPLIALASNLAKVRRDRYMVNLSYRVPEYGFEKHKGYGTAEHMRSIRKHGISVMHRRQFVHL